MYAVIETGGKQYKVSEGDKITVEKLDGESGSKIIFDQVLLLGGIDKIVAGAPIVANSSVHGEVVKQFRGEKIIVFKKQRRQNHRRKNGHRQSLTEIEIKEIKTKA
jgi:large subunit ribosomal protein L21